MAGHKYKSMKSIDNGNTKKIKTSVSCRLSSCESAPKTSNWSSQLRRKIDKIDSWWLADRHYCITAKPTYWKSYLRGSQRKSLINDRKYRSNPLCGRTNGQTNGLFRLEGGRARVFFSSIFPVILLPFNVLAIWRGGWSLWARTVLRPCGCGLLEGESMVSEPTLVPVDVKIVTGFPFLFTFAAEISALSNEKQITTWDWATWPQ